MFSSVSARYRVCLACGLLVGAVLAIYGNIGSHTPIAFDDALYVTGNSFVLRGLTLEGVWWAFANVDAANWHPITWLSHMIDQEFFSRSGAQFFENVWWHAGNSLLVYALMRRFFVHRGLAFALALVFACHPQNVESVAWLSQRKTLLSTFFLLGTILIYLDWRMTRRTSSLVIMIGAYLASLMAKAMGVTLPLILFAYELLAADAATHNAWRAWRACSDWRPMYAVCSKAVVRQSHFLVIAVIVALLTLRAQADSGAVASIEVVSFHARLFNACRSLGVYLNTFFVPSNLCFFYPFDYRPSWGEIAYGMFLLPCIVLFYIAALKRFTWGVFGLMWFCTALLPVIGLIQVGSQSHADRYMYFPMIGLIIFLGDVMSNGVLAPTRNPLLAATGVIAAFAVGMGAHAYAYLPHWRNAEAAYQRSLEVGGTSYIMVGNLAVEYSRAGFPKAALTLNQVAHQIRPSSSMAIGNMAGAYMRLGKWEEAALWYAKAIEIEPNKLQYWFNCGMALGELNRDEESEVMLQRAKSLLPKDPSWDNSIEYMRAVLERRVPVPGDAVPVEVTH